MSRSVLDFKVKPFKKQTIPKVRLRIQELLLLFIPEKFEDVLTIIMVQVSENNYFEGVIAEVFKCLWSCNFSLEFILDRILNLLEELIIKNRHDEAKAIARALPSSIDDNLVEMHSDGVTRLLRLYHLSVEITEPQSKLYQLKTSFENSLLKIFYVIKPEELSKLVPRFLNLTFETDFVSEVALVEFAFTIKHAFKRISNNEIEDNLQPEILEFLLAAMSSKCKTKCSLACQYLTFLIDHHGNSDEILLPKLFYNRTPYKLNMPKVENESAIKIIEEYRQLIQSSIVSAIKLHSCNLSVFFKAICVLITNIPSSNTVIIVISTLMELQSYALETELPKIESNHIHAFIISIMTLICWVTRAKALNKYIHGIVRARCCQAPHLNPPLRKLYEYEDHHIVDYKDELFLDKWEIRYCLWNRYRLNEEQLAEIATRNDCGGSECGKQKRFSRFFRMNLFRRKSEMNFFGNGKCPSGLEI